MQTIILQQEEILGCGILVVLNFYWKVSSLPILEDVTVFNFPADAAQDDWAWTEVLGPGSGIIKMSSPKTINGDIVAIEMYIIKEMIPATLAPEIGIGIFSSDENWSDNGVLPNTATGDPAPLMTLKLQ